MKQRDTAGSVLVTTLTREEHEALDDNVVVMRKRWQSALRRCTACNGPPLDGGDLCCNCQAFYDR